MTSFSEWKKSFSFICESFFSYCVKMCESVRFTFQWNEKIDETDVASIFMKNDLKVVLSFLLKSRDLFAVRVFWTCDILIWYGNFHKGFCKIFSFFDHLDIWIYFKSSFSQNRDLLVEKSKLDYKCELFPFLVSFQKSTCRYSRIPFFNGFFVLI